jgi:hypothetical protein
MMIRAPGTSSIKCSAAFQEIQEAIGWPDE